MYNAADYAGETLEQYYEEAHEARHTGSTTIGGNDYAIEMRAEEDAPLSANAAMAAINGWLRGARVIAAAHSDRRAA
jgi:hypothetical protein